jgi:hypothetical protein
LRITGVRVEERRVNENNGLNLLDTARATSEELFIQETVSSLALGFLRDWSSCSMIEAKSSQSLRFVISSRYPKSEMCQISMLDRKQSAEVPLN